jgi:hypothetical protein
MWCSRGIHATLLGRRGDWDDSMGASPDRVRDSSAGIPRIVCVQLDAAFVGAGAGRDGNGDMEALCRFKGGEKVKGLADGWTEAIRRICWAWGLIVSLSWDVSTWRKGGLFLSLCSSGSGSRKGVLLPVPCNAREGCTPWPLRWERSGLGTRSRSQFLSTSG